MTQHSQALKQIPVATVTSQQCQRQNFEIGQFDTVHTSRQVIQCMQNNAQDTKIYLISKSIIPSQMPAVWKLPSTLLAV